MNFLPLLAGIPEAIGKYFIERNAQKSAERLRKMEFEDALHARKLKLIEQGLHADMNWEMEFARQAATSWKDEYTLIVVSIPMVMAFIPGLAQYVKLGFEAFASTPLWYQVMVQAVFYATYGMRFFRRTQSDT
jgi:hypothetical protein